MELSITVPETVYDDALDKAGTKKRLLDVVSQMVVEWANAIAVPSDDNEEKIKSAMASVESQFADLISHLSESQKMVIYAHVAMPDAGPEQLKNLSGQPLSIVRETMALPIFVQVARLNTDQGLVIKYRRKLYEHLLELATGRGEVRGQDKYIALAMRYFGDDVQRIQQETRSLIAHTNIQPQNFLEAFEMWVKRGQALKIHPDVYREELEKLNGTQGTIIQYENESMPGLPSPDTTVRTEQAPRVLEGESRAQGT